MSELSFRQNPREGQRRVIQLAAEPDRRQLCAQLPTGYGKTFTSVATYSTLQRQGRVDRLLYIVPSTGQLEQFAQDGAADLHAASVQGPAIVCDIAFYGAAQAVKRHRQGTCQVFACTIQGLSSVRVKAVVNELMQSGRWMICVDEYHHYGIEKTWGSAVIELTRLPSCQFLLALSATPYRPDDDSAFGQPDPRAVVTYRQAVEERAVKPLECHSYTYRVDAIDNGDVVSYTTQDLADMTDDASPEAIERVFRQMRWSPKYISPLVDVPISRMIRSRIATGQRLQALVGAFCCSHAQLVCEQIRAMFPELSVDWVGTGTNGRSDKENRDVLRRFCPPKVDGKRRKQDIGLDVLVHVGMAGEGLDTVFVSEVIHLNPANRNNSNDQENGRAARWLATSNGEPIRGYINVESGTDYGKDWLGRKIELAFDAPPGTKVEDDGEDETPEPSTDDDLPELPDEPSIEIIDCECTEIKTGELVEIQHMAEALHEVSGVSLDDQKLQDKAVELYLRRRKQVAEASNERSIIEQWKEAVSGALSLVARRAAVMMTAPGARMDKGLIGDVKKRINSQKKRYLGAVDADVDLLSKHYNWLKNLEQQMLREGLPSWLQ
jgi:superfamily II DNA or RNA helicase